METVLHALTKPEVLALLGSAIAVSGLQQTFTNAVENEVRKIGSRTQLFLTTFLSGLAAVLVTLATALQANPLALGKYTILILGLAQFVYRYVVQPFSKIVTDARAYRATQRPGVLPDGV
jgi:hypothetical protein